MEKNQDGLNICRLRPGDAAALAEFYNGLSERSRTTFRPLGWTTCMEACAGIVRDQATPAPVPGDRPLHQGRKYDLVVLCDQQIVGWSFVWSLHSDQPTFGLGVADAYQGRGLGAALMDRVLEAAQGLGIRHLELTVVQDNLVAWQMYARRGFKRYREYVDEKDGVAYYRMRRTC